MDKLQRKADRNRKNGVPLSGREAFFSGYSDDANPFTPDEIENRFWSADWWRANAEAFSSHVRMTTGIFRSHFHYPSSPNEMGRVYETSINVIHAADSREEALKHAVLYWKNRHEAWPELFSELWAMKIYEIQISRISGEGSWPGESPVQIFEYKCDWGWPSVDACAEATIKKWAALSAYPA